MKRKNIAVSLAISLTLMVVCGLLISSGHGVVASVQAKEDGENQSQLEGTWILNVAPPQGGPPAYFSLASFAGGGVLTTSPDPSVGPGASTGQGTWERTRGTGNGFTSSHVAYMYDAGGQITGAVRINSNYHLIGKDVLEGSGQIQFCDPSVNNCFTPPGCPALAVIRGTRLHAVPPSCPH
jgi:hypothetical protein